MRFSCIENITLLAGQKQLAEAHVAMSNKLGDMSGRLWALQGNISSFFRRNQ